ncbi:MAG: substrate-binding domain-containing protein [Chloroflexota bacterium]|nr:substrate-binding domain-containing protein [Chloroflexota bacterium]
MSGVHAQVCAAPEGAIGITIAYPSEFAFPMQRLMEDFNTAYGANRDPLTGEPLPATALRLHICGMTRISGRAMDDVVNHINGVGFDPESYEAIGGELPMIWIPSVSHWALLANELTETPLYNLAQTPSIVHTAVVVGIWESRLDVIADRLHDGDRTRVTVADLIQVAHEGWFAFDGVETIGRDNVLYGRTNPFTSSTGLSISMLEFYTCARMNNVARGTLNETLSSPGLLTNPAVQTCLRQFYNAISFEAQTTAFMNTIAERQSALVDFAPMSEDDFLRLTAQVRQGTEPRVDVNTGDRFLALYPAEGTFWHDYPFLIPDRQSGHSWLTSEEEAATAIFREFLLSERSQAVFLASGFRPSNATVDPLAVGSPYEPLNDTETSWNRYGVIPQPSVNFFNAARIDPTAASDMPDPVTLNAIQLDWCSVKERAYIIIVLDASDSMRDKFTEALEAVETFLDNADSGDRVGLMVFSSELLTRFYVDITRDAPLSTNRDLLKATLADMQRSVDEENGADTGLFGSTDLYDTLIEAVRDIQMVAPNMTASRAILLLSDGEDSRSSDPDAARRALIADLRAVNDSTRLGRVLLIPIDYTDEEVGSSRTDLDDLALASNSTVESSTPSNIETLLDTISSGFSTSARCPVL